MKRLLAWTAVLLPPTLLIVLALKPLEINSLRLIGLFFSVALSILLWVQMAAPVSESKKRFRQLTAVSLITVASIVAFNWPLQAAYSLSRPAFDQVAEQVESGKTLSTPRRVGWFRIQRIEAAGLADNQIDEHGLRLWTNLHPSGKTGFVQSSPDDLRFNLWSHFRLDETWQFISED
ncbi:MAG: hypothetical protein AAGI45_18950 [Cyanobacteria bacterium P01_H01_bin.26]